MKQQSEGRAVNALSALEPFARAWRSAAPEFRAYKRLDLYDHLVGPIIDRAPAAP